MFQPFPRRWRFFVVICIPLLLASPELAAQGRYMENGEFLEAALGVADPDVGVIWITDSLRPTIEDILGHKFASLRVRYWHKGVKTAWILNEIGKG